MTAADFTQRSDGKFYFMLPSPDGKVRKGVCTGQFDLESAMRVVAETGIDRLKKLAEAKAITREAIEIITGARERTVGQVLTEFEAWIPMVTGVSVATMTLVYVRAMIREMRCIKMPLVDVNEVMLSAAVHADNPSLRVASDRLKFIRKFYEFAIHQDYVMRNPARLIAIRHASMTMEQVKTQKVCPMLEAEYQCALNGLEQPWRDWTVLGYCAGQRISDAVMMEAESLSSDHINFFPMKGRRRTEVELRLYDPNIGRPELIELVERKRREKTTGYLWPEFRDWFLRKQSDVSTYYARKIRKLGIQGRTFHSLRRAFIIRMDDAGVPLTNIAKYVGHADIETTKHYIESKFNLPPVAEFRPADEPKTSAQLTAGRSAAADAASGSSVGEAGIRRESA